MSMSDESLPLPAYSFVPGGPWPHPTGSPQGHSFGRERSTLAPIDTIKTVDSAPFLRGIALFNAGYYWEAHDAWESLWHAHGRRGVVADVIKALIKLEAAGVKVSMDGKGRWADNVFVERLWRTIKQEELYLKRYETVPLLQLGLQAYFPFYNEERRHQALDYWTPGACYRARTNRAAG